MKKNAVLIGSLWVFLLFLAVSGCGTSTVSKPGNEIIAAAVNGLTNDFSKMKEVLDFDKIEDSAFIGCDKLKEITLSSRVVSIGNCAFYDCFNLTNVTIEAVKPPALGNYAFDHKLAVIRVPSVSLASYKSADGWSNYASIIIPH